MTTLACNELLTNLTEEIELLIPLAAIVFGCITAMVAIGFGVIGGIAKSRATEQTRREIAAYVAEGTIRPEDAIAMLNAGRPDDET